MYAHPAYQEISHFRAPYKNAYLSGYGYYGQDELAPPAQVPEILVKEDNVYRWKGDYQKVVLEQLKNMRYIFIGGPTERVQVVPYTPEEMAAMADPAAKAALMAFNARKWVDDRLAEGKVVFAPVWILMPEITQTDELAAIPAGDKARVAEAASTPLVGILAEPSGISIAGMRISWPMLAIGTAVIAGGAMLFMRRRRRG